MYIIYLGESYIMSIVALKRKTAVQYENMSVGRSAFALNGTRRLQGFVGQTSLSRSNPPNVMRGNAIKGHGGCCGTYPVFPLIQPVYCLTEDSNVVKSSVLSNTGMIATKYRWIRRPAPYSTVKPDSNLNVNTQQQYIANLHNETLASFTGECAITTKNPIISCNPAKVDSNLNNDLYLRSYYPFDTDFAGKELWNYGSYFSNGTITNNLVATVRPTPIITINSNNYTDVPGQTIISSGSSVDLLYGNYYQAFDGSNATIWHSAVNVYNNGVYTGSASTAISGVGTVVGEWLQIQSPYQYVLKQYTLTVRSGQGVRMPRVFYIVGSNNGITWTPIDSQNYTNNTTGLTTLTINTTANTAPYSYYRIVINALYNSVGATNAEILDWSMVGAMPNMSLNTAEKIAGTSSLDLGTMPSSYYTFSNQLPDPYNFTLQFFFYTPSGYTEAINNRFLSLVLSGGIGGDKFAFYRFGGASRVGIDSNMGAPNGSGGLNLPPTKDGIWHQIVLIVRNGNTEMYWDGVLRNIAASTINGHNTISISFGTILQTPQVAGRQIDELRLYTRALTETEVMNLYYYRGTLDIPLTCPNTFVAETAKHIYRDASDYTDLRTKIATSNDVVYVPKSTLNTPFAC